MDMKTILQKVKQKGVRGTCRAVVRRVSAVPNKAFLWWYQRHCPIQQNLILFESDGDLMDNGYALSQHRVPA